jgi:hypothetical protein
VARHGIDGVSASVGVVTTKPQPGEAACDLHLREGQPVKIHLKIGQRDPMDWVHWAV